MAVETKETKSSISIRCKVYVEYTLQLILNTTYYEYTLISTFISTGLFVT